MGVDATDGRLIRPIEKPTVDKVSFDWEEINKKALARSPDLRRQRWRIKQRELELMAARNLLQPDVNTNSAYRWLGLPDGGQRQEADQSKVDDSSPRDGNREAKTSDSERSPEWQLGLQSTTTIGLRKKLAQLRHFQLQLARERAKLQDEELEVSHQLTDAVRQLEFNYQLMQTNFNRALAADRQMEAMQAAFEVETVTLDQLLEAQRRRAEAQTSYFRTLLDYQRSIVTVNCRAGSLL
jgi:outer membrane protein TolC